jgi:hypothetical protein
MVAAEADDCYQALRLVRRIMRHEDVILGRNLAMPEHPGTGMHSAHRQPPWIEGLQKRDNPPAELKN